MSPREVWVCDDEACEEGVDSRFRQELVEEISAGPGGESVRVRTRIHRYGDMFGWAKGGAAAHS
jgi:hypothetical protein